MRAFSFKDANNCGANLQSNFSTLHCYRFGFVDFETIEEATKAKDEFQGRCLDGRDVAIDFSRPRAERSGGRQSMGDEDTPSEKLMVRGLSYDTTEDTLLNLYSGCDHVHIATQRETGNSRG